MNIYEKMAAITAELNAVAKNLKVGEGRSAYKAVGEADVLAAVKPLEEKYKVYSYPVSRRIVESDVVTKKKVWDGKESETSSYFMRLETIYRFVNTEQPDDYIDITTYGDGIDTNDKAPGKAMTYGDKYALLKAYKIITGDDPDQQYSDEGAIKRAPKKHVACTDCGALIEDSRRRDGTPWPMDEIVRYSQGRFGRALCPDCQRKAFAAEKSAEKKARELDGALQGIRNDDAGDRA